MAVPDCPALYIHHFKVGHDVRGQSWTVRMSVVVRYNQLELKHKHIGTRTYRYMGIERVYDTATHPGLSIKVPMSGTGQNRDSQGREYSRW